jgi:hypothetical protein
MGKVIVVFNLDKFLSALLRLEYKIIVAACRDASVIRGFYRVRNVRTRKIRYELGKFPFFILRIKKIQENIIFGSRLHEHFPEISGQSF